MTEDSGQQPGEGTDPPGPVLRAFRLLAALAEADGPVGGKDLSDRLGLPPSTVHRLLQILTRAGMAERAADGQRYVPGPDLARLAFAVVRRSDPAALARPFVRGVVEALDVTTVFWLLHRASAALTAAVVQPSSHALDFRDVAFGPRGLVWGSVGRAVLAFLPPAEAEALVRRAGPSPTGLPPPDAAALAAELEAIRAAGVAVSEGQTLAGAIGFAAPVFGAEGEVLGCIGATLPVSRYAPAARARYEAVITAAARGLSTRLGHAPLT